jgi:hypothetical protein
MTQAANDNAMHERKIANDNMQMPSEFSLNKFIFDQINVLMTEFSNLTIYGTNGDSKTDSETYSRKIRILHCALDILCIKLKVSEIAAFNSRIRDIERLLEKLFITTFDGEVRINIELNPIVDRKINDFYQEMLREYDARGLLTKQKKDPRLAITMLE